MGNGPRRISLLCTPAEMAAEGRGLFKGSVFLPPEMRTAELQITCLEFQGGWLPLQMWTSSDRKRWKAVMDVVDISGPCFMTARPKHPHEAFVRLWPDGMSDVALTLGAWLVERPT